MALSEVLGPRPIDAIMEQCHGEVWRGIWFVADSFILITGVAANVALVWLFVRERKSLSASQVLGVNLVVMNLIFLSFLPFFLIYGTVRDKQVNGNHSDFSHTAWHNGTTSILPPSPLDEAQEIFNIFNLIGCPLLLACMCIERYLAVIRPLLYLRVRRWEYRMAVSAVVWAITLSFCLAIGAVEDVTIILLPVSIIISCLFVLMIACLGGMVWSLQQQSPAHATHGNHARTESPLKKRAVVNVLVVVVPAVMAYFPILLMVPLVLYICSGTTQFDRDLCDVFELSLLFPRFGVFIGPLFYLSKARQTCCLSGR